MSCSAPPQNSGGLWTLCQSALGQVSMLSVCTRPGQHVTDRIGPYQPYQPQVPGAEFGLGEGWRLAMTSIGVPGPSLGNPPVVVFSLGLKTTRPPLGLVACQRGVPLPDSSVAHCSVWYTVCRLTHLTLRVPVLGSRGLSPSSSPASQLGPQGSL